MEKPTRLIAKVIETLSVINEADVPYTPIEKEIILHYIRAAYIQLINVPVSDELPNEVRFSLDAEPNGASQQLEQEFKAQIESLTKQLEELQQAGTASQEEVVDLRNQLEIKNEGEKSHTTQLQQLQSEVNRSKEEHQQMMDALQQKNDTISQLQTEIESLKKEAAATSEPVSEQVSPEREEMREDPPKIIEIPKETEKPTATETPKEETKEVAPQPQPGLQTDLFMEDDIVEFIRQDDPKETQPVSPKPQTIPYFEQKEEPKKEKRSLHDLLSDKKEDNSVVSHFQQSKIHDLTKAITINDKFLFIKELFKGKGEEFSSAIQKINNSSNMDEAFGHIDEMKNYYFWDTTAPAYLTFCDLVRRKFI